MAHRGYCRRLITKPVVKPPTLTPLNLEIQDHWPVSFLLNNCSGIYPNFTFNSIPEMPGPAPLPKTWKGQQMEDWEMAIALFSPAGICCNHGGHNQCAPMFFFQLFKKRASPHRPNKASSCALGYQMVRAGILVV